MRMGLASLPFSASSVDPEEQAPKARTLAVRRPTPRRICERMVIIFPFASGNCGGKTAQEIVIVTGAHGGERFNTCDLNTHSHWRMWKRYNSAEKSHGIILPWFSTALGSTCGAVQHVRRERVRHCRLNGVGW